ncbi:hypothetical protein [Ligilactobacillus agilis]|nr:hypothetical protein [Ligilactobacillus agilis]
MAFYLDMTSVLDTFKSEVTVISEAQGRWIDGQWVEDAEGERKTFYEPFVPNDRIGVYSLVDILRETGHIEQYNAVWISAQAYPLGTIVEHKATKYKVANIQDLTDYSNVTLYYLQSEVNDNGINKL